MADIYFSNDYTYGWDWQVNHMLANGPELAIDGGFPPEAFTSDGLRQIRAEGREDLCVGAIDAELSRRGESWAS